MGGGGAGWQRPGMDAHLSVTRPETPRRNQGDACRRGRVGAGHSKHQPAHFQRPPSSVGTPRPGLPRPGLTRPAESTVLEPPCGPQPSPLGQVCAWRQKAVCDHQAAEALPGFAVRLKTSPPLLSPAQVARAFSLLVPRPQVSAILLPSG